jgi:hypothetical protein
MSKPVIAQRISAALRVITLELDAQRAQVDDNHRAVMAKLDAILSHMPGVMQTIETHSADIESLKRTRLSSVPTNGKGARQ